MAMMANRLRLFLPHCLFLLLCYDIVAIVAHHPSSPDQASPKTNQQHPLSYNNNNNLRPNDFPNDRLYRAYHVIQSFKSTITSDPKNITGTWTGNDICGEKSYVGFYCATVLIGRANKEELTVTAVLLNGFGLRAPKLQGFVDQLPDVALFHAASNSFGTGGGIPQLTTGLGYSYDLSVDDDDDDGDSDLQVQDYSEVTGHAAAKVHCIAATIDFRIRIGQLPADLGFSKLSFLALASNRLTGPIPKSVAHLKDSLLEVLLLNNQLSGCLAPELGMLAKAAVIDAGTNQLTGPIPSSFSCLRSVEQLNLAGNLLYGEVPDALCKLAGPPAGRLANLTLSGNYFTSVGPACAALIKDGVLDVKNNCIPGFANQRRPAECAAFQRQPKTCPAASTVVTCPSAAASAKDAVAPGERKARDYFSYVTYATFHE